MKKELKHLQPIVCIWRDSRMYVTQISPDELPDICVMKTCGYFCGYTELGVIIARDLVDDDYRGVLVIPKENIVSIKSL
jgi:hypothetical protein